MSVSTIPTTTEDGAIRPFQIEVPQEEIDALRRQIGETRWPHKELVDDHSQGVQSALMQALTSYWTTDYDWRKGEADAERAAAVQDRNRRS